MVANVHMLYHIPQCVRRLGPLWVYWCYPFESVLGHLAGYVYGTKQPQYSFCFAATANHLHAALSCKFGDKGLLFGQDESIVTDWITIDGNLDVRVLPSGQERTELPLEFVRKYGQAQTCLYVSRILVKLQVENPTLLSTWKPGKKKDSSVVEFEDEAKAIKYGRILHFLWAKISDSIHIWALVKIHTFLPNQLHDHHMLFFEDRFVCKYVALKSIKSKVMMCSSTNLTKWNGQAVGYIVKPIWTTTQL